MNLQAYARQIIKPFNQVHQGSPLNKETLNFPLSPALLYPAMNLKELTIALTETVMFIKIKSNDKWADCKI